MSDIPHHAHPPSRRIALIGYGAIARAVLKQLEGDDTANCCLGVLLRPDSHGRSDLPGHVTLLADEAALRAFRPDLVVEAAGHAAVRAFVPGLLRAGIAVLISSVGALHDEALRAACEEAGQSGGARLIIPSGALAGVDYVRAVRGLADLSVRYESRKGVAAWRHELTDLGHDPDLLEAPVTLLHGSAREAAARFPASLNVAATLALAGNGFEAIETDVIVDPALEGIRHSIEVESVAGRMRVVIDNRASRENPRSSALVAPAICAAIRQYFSVIQML